MEESTSRLYVGRGNIALISSTKLLSGTCCRLETYRRHTNRHVFLGHESCAASQWTAVIIDIEFLYICIVLVHCILVFQCFALYYVHGLLDGHVWLHCIFMMNCFLLMCCILVFLCFALYSVYGLMDDHVYLHCMFIMNWIFICVLFCWFFMHYFVLCVQTDEWTCVTAL